MNGPTPTGYALILTPLVAFLLLASPVRSSEPGTVVGSGHIEAGIFSAEAILYPFIGEWPEWLDRPDRFALPLTGILRTWVETQVEDHSGTGYFVEMSFYGSDGRVDTDCSATPDSHAVLQPPYGTAEIRMRCLVPLGAERVAVHAHTGIDLDVTVVTIAPPA